MHRNLRVKRTLDEWRQENSSYISLVPWDIVGLILPYITPDIWKDKAIVEKIWSVEFPPLNVKTCFLSDGSVVMGHELKEAQIVHLDGRITPCPIELPRETRFQPDREGGFWYSKGWSKMGFTTCHYPNRTTHIYPIRYYRNNYTEDRWYVVHSVILEDGSSYLLYQGGSRGNDGCALIARYSPDDQMEFIHELFHGYDYLSYQDGKLFLSDNVRRYVINRPFASSEEFRLQLAGRKEASSNPDQWLIKPLIITKGPDPVADFSDSLNGDIFYLTEKNNSPCTLITFLCGIYLYKSNHENDILLWDFPEGMIGLKLYLLPSGEIHFLVQQGDKISLFRFY